jgi:hypothetical protein
MKGKKSTQAVLLVFVLAVWGVIFYKIYDKLTAEDDEPVAFDLPGNSLPLAHAVDTFKLLANYNDPFAYESFREARREASAPSAPAVKPIVKIAAKPTLAVADPQVKYLGMIRNNASKKKVALVIIDGKSSMLQEKQSLDDVKLLRIFNDSLEIMIGHKKCFIRK